MAASGPEDASPGHWRVRLFDLRADSHPFGRTAEDA
jgi:hypothetical protein